MAKAGRLIISLGIAPSGLERGLRRVQRRIGGLSRQLNSAGRGLTAGLTAPLAAFGAMAIRSSVIFEDAFADVRKTVKGAGDDLSDSIRKMSKDLPLSATKIAGVVEELGRLGVQKENIIGAADAMVRLAETSTLSATDAATAIAKFANIMGTAEADIGRLASTLTVLGSEFPTTETDIINMATRLAGAGRIAGLAESDVLALSTALSSVGIRAEAGGTAISRVMQEIFTAVKDGGEKLDILADVAGMTAEEFRAAYEDKAVGAILAFIGGLGNLSDEGARVFEVLNDLDFGAIRVKTALLNSSLAVETATRALRRSSEEWAEFAALWELS